VTIAKRPSFECGTRKEVELICPTAQAQYFSHEDWTTQISLKSLSKIAVFAQVIPGQPERAEPGIHSHKPASSRKIVDERA